MNVIKAGLSDGLYSPADARNSALGVIGGEPVLTSGGRAPAQTTGIGGTGTSGPPASSSYALTKITDWAGKLATAALSSKEDQLQQALVDAAVKIAEEELAKAVDAVPFGKALRLTIRYSTVFADAAGVVIDERRASIQQTVDDAVNFSQDNGLTGEDVARIQRARSFLAIAVGDTVDALEAGFSATVEAILTDAADTLKEAAADVTSQITGAICQKLLSASKVDRVLLAVAQEVRNNVPEARLKMYRVLSNKLVRALIASFADSKAQRARLEALLTAAGSTEDPSVGVLRSLVDIGVVDAMRGVFPLSNLFPKSSQVDEVTLGMLVGYEAKRAAKAVIDELRAGGWGFGTHNGDTGIVVDEARKHIDLPHFDATELVNGPPLPNGVLGMLDDDLASDEQALASVYDGLEGALMLRAAAYQADIDSSAGAGWVARLAACQQDAEDASSALSNAARGLRTRYAGTALDDAAARALPVDVTIPPATLRAAPSPGISQV